MLPSACSSFTCRWVCVCRRCAVGFAFPRRVCLSRKRLHLVWRVRRECLFSVPAGLLSVSRVSFGVEGESDTCFGSFLFGLGVYAYLLFLDSFGFPYQSLLCVSPPKQCVRRLRSLKGHVCACGCNIKMFRTVIVLAQAVLTFYVQHLHCCCFVIAIAYVQPQVVQT